ncbi:diadenosine tetraphosphate hydrolase [Streptomyces sp. NRRL B-1677]|uniref:Diadenosine tetraphosphate hydrolase n=1 Tax=Streptomyces klenkii TaxID=1420899 RepID=A0A3B0BY67_9ACTN|nr:MULTISPECIES: diadenosine tetraphosphate hydrolase [Streptomyces]MBF6049460.1 diadenosine tetraphosphate hydrolase [Streptomyces sp. NRRL B-1677]RKN77411.1 diadenosine tetraphosphate hydrolase [Streptomyces klenkii]
MTYTTDRIGSALRGENPTVLRRLTTSFAVIGDVQFLPGYCVLLLDDPDVEHFTDLSKPRRLAFLADMDVLGEAVQLACRKLDSGFRKVNLEILGNTDRFVHAHIWPRYDWEPAHLIPRPVGAYPRGHWHEPRYALGSEHKQLREAITAELDSLVNSDRTQPPPRAGG